MDTLCHCVESVATTTPQRTALIDGPRQLDYGPFWQQARAFAAHLRQQGIHAGDRVALILPNRLEAAIACYGIWLAGAVAVPMNAQARQRDFLAWLRHCQARHVLYEASHADPAQAIAQLHPAPSCTVLADAAPLPGSTVAGSTATLPQPAHLALILYTSGTTGAPKGVMLTHANLYANAQAIVSYLALCASDRVLSVLPFYYAYGASVLHTHLMQGACLVLGPSLIFPHQVLDALEQAQATGFSGVPSTFALLLDPLAQRGHAPASLRYLTQAGAAMSPALTHRLRQLWPGPRLYVMYGQTEATSRISWLPPEWLDKKTGSVGIPVPGVQWQILREDTTPAATGESGEVCVRGPNIMAGYWQNPQATAQVLREGWLHTGDIGYLDNDGYLFLQGRRSDMIKTGAHRVHPIDVEDTIAELPWVDEVAVVGVEDAQWGQIIRAVIVCRHPPPPQAEQRIKAHCRQHLAAYKIPRQILFTDRLPRTASGKLRRIQLTEQSLPP